MPGTAIHGNNRLIRTSIARVLPACFAATMTGSITLMMDSLLAGSLLGALSIAAVAIGNPVINILRALVQTVSSGAAVKITVNIGRGDQQEINRAYSMGVFGTIILGVLAMLVSILGAGTLAGLFGGNADPEAARQGMLYILACAPSILFFSLNFYMGKVLSVYGCQKLVFLNAVISVCANLGFSIVGVKLLPAEMAILGLGIGTSIATVIVCCMCFTIVKLKKLPLKLSLRGFTLTDMGQALVLGIPTSGNNLADGVVSGVVNNIILRGFGGDTTALAIYTAVKGVATFAQAVCMGTALATAPLFGLLYGARDKNGLKRTLREGYKVGLAFAVVWCGVLAAALPVLMRFYGMEGNLIMRNGTLICMAFTPVILAIRIMTQLFESTEKAAMGLYYSVIPDSVIFPVMLLALMPALGYLGIWIAYGANGIVFVVLMYLVRSLKLRDGRMSADRLLCLDESVRDNVPMLDISIRSDSGDIAGLSEQIHHFLARENISGRCAYLTALCLEELSADFLAHMEQEHQKNSRKEIMDVKIFSDEKTLRLIIRNAAKAYNPLNFELDDTTFAKVGVKMAQKVARNIEYSYVYGMNIVNIDLDK